MNYTSNLQITQIIQIVSKLYKKVAGSDLEAFKWSIDKTNKGAVKACDLIHMVEDLGDRFDRKLAL